MRSANGVTAELAAGPPATVRDWVHGSGCIFGAVNPEGPVVIWDTGVLARRRTGRSGRARVPGWGSPGPLPAPLWTLPPGRSTRKARHYPAGTRGQSESRHHVSRGPGGRRECPHTAAGFLIFGAGKRNAPGSVPGRRTNRIEKGWSDAVTADTLCFAQLRTLGDPWDRDYMGSHGMRLGYRVPGLCTVPFVPREK
jgi:hypothetical protein